MKRIQKISIIFSWVILGLVVVFVFGVVAAIQKWIDRPWATGIAEVAVLLILLLIVALCVCFLLDRGQRPTAKSKDESEAEVDDDDFADLGIGGGDDLDEGDEFEELEPLPDDPLGGDQPGEAESLGSLEDEDIGTL